MYCSLFSGEVSQSKLGFFFLGTGVSCAIVPVFLTVFGFGRSQSFCVMLKLSVVSALGHNVGNLTG